MCVCVSVVNLIIHYRNKLFYNGDDELPVYTWNGSNVHYSLDSLADVLLNDSVQLSCVCSKQPVHVCYISFIVDLEMLEDPTDVRADEKGVRMRQGSPVAYVSKHIKEGKAKFFRRTKKPTHAHQFKITRTYYQHAASHDFTRMIVVAHGECIQ